MQQIAAPYGGGGGSGGVEKYRAGMRSGIFHALSLSSTEAAAGIEDH